MKDKKQEIIESLKQKLPDDYLNKTQQKLKELGKSFSKSYISEVKDGKKDNEEILDALIEISITYQNSLSEKLNKIKSA